MRTIGHHRPANSPRGDFRAACDYCGIVWPRSKLWRDGAGKLVCPDEGPGADYVTLTERDAETRERVGREGDREVEGSNAESVVDI